MPHSLVRPLFRSLVRPSTRLFHSTSRICSSPLTLHHDLHPAPKSTAPPGAPIIFLHGLFGSSKNNRAISKVLARDLHRPVYALDLRNHGSSPHSARHDYVSMAEDVEHFMTTHELTRAVVIGHSMGAKVAMTMALRRHQNQNADRRAPPPLAAVIAIDNAPVDAVLKSDFGAYCAGMRAVAKEAAGGDDDDAETPVRGLADADRILAKYEPDLAVRQFLLTNLVRDKGSGRYGWRVPVETLARSLGHMADFPFRGDAGETRWEGPALFVRGTRSKYVADDTLPVIGRFFPRFELRDIEAGHWVVSEQPEEFRRVVVEWLGDKE